MTGRTALGPLSALERLTDDTGLFEHAWHSVPRYSSGYCTDDNGRALAIVCEIGGESAALLARRFLAFLAHAHLGEGRFRLRLRYDRRWTDDPPSEDADGRAIRGIATAAALGPTSDIRQTASSFFTSVADRDFIYWRARSNAVVGATTLLAARPNDRPTHESLQRWAGSLPRGVDDGTWPWPEPRLGYENALLPHALLRAGVVLDDDSLIQAGLVLLDWLIETETRADCFSFTPTGGAAAGDRRPAFDQQPIEAWSMAEATAAALDATDDPKYRVALRRTATWFEGRNDVGVAMIDPSTGGGFDGLESTGVNQNQGGESLLAAVAVQHLAQACEPEGR